MKTFEMEEEMVEVAPEIPKTLLNLPEELIEGHLLPFLKWNDLLRFRRVCKTTQFITDDYINVHPELAPEIEINEENKRFGDFLEMGIPTTKFFLKNISGDEFYAKEETDIALFLERYGGIIKSLRVHHLSVAVFGKELDFMEGLVNLQKLYVGRVFYGVKEDSSQSELEKMTALHGRACRLVGEIMGSRALSNLTVLEIGQEVNTWKPARALVDLTGQNMLERNAMSLEQVCIPFVAHTEPPSLTLNASFKDPEYSMSFMIPIFMYHIQRRAESLKKGVLSTKKKFQVVDFANFHDPKMSYRVHWNASLTFPELVDLCAKNGIKLKNVASFWFIRLHHQPHLTPADLGAPVVSLVGLQPCIFSLDMPNLEKIEIQATATSSVGVNWRAVRPEWPALRHLNFNVDSKNSQHLFIGNGDQMLSVATTETKTLFQFFFQDVVRPELTELCFRFDFAMNPASLAIPKAVEIVASCPNLKMLTLINWPGTNKALAELFGGIPGLEEVSLEHCKNLGNVAFVGADARDPVFFKLPKLRKLSLKGLDHMPKITDLLFTMVIRHLKLTHFIITSNSPVK